MEATLAVTLHLWRLERETMTILTGATEGEDPKCLRHTWLRAKLCSSFAFNPSPPLLFFFLLPCSSWHLRVSMWTFILYDLSNLYIKIWTDPKERLVCTLRANHLFILFFDTVTRESLNIICLEERTRSSFQDHCSSLKLHRTPASKPTTKPLQPAHKRQHVTYQKSHEKA